MVDEVTELGHRLDYSGLSDDELVSLLKERPFLRVSISRLIEFLPALRERNLFVHSFEVEEELNDGSWQPRTDLSLYAECHRPYDPDVIQPVIQQAIEIVSNATRDLRVFAAIDGWDAA